LKGIHNKIVKRNETITGNWYIHVMQSQKDSNIYN